MCVSEGACAGRRLGGRLLRQFTEARQQCCHPQIVRRDLWLGKSRLSMRQILTRLVHRAFSEYDIAVRAEFTARILQAAVSCDPADAGECSSVSLSSCTCSRQAWLASKSASSQLWPLGCPAEASHAERPRECQPASLA